MKEERNSRTHRADVLVVLREIHRTFGAICVESWLFA